MVCGIIARYFVRNNINQVFGWLETLGRDQPASLAATCALVGSGYGSFPWLMTGATAVSKEEELPSCDSSCLSCGLVAVASLCLHAGRSIVLETHYHNRRRQGCRVHWKPPIHVSFIHDERLDTETAIIVRSLRPYFDATLGYFPQLR